MFHIIFWHYCKVENRLPHGIVPVSDLLDQMNESPKVASMDPYVYMKKLGPIYLNEIDMNLNQANKNGDNLLYLGKA